MQLLNMYASSVAQFSYFNCDSIRTALYGMRCIKSNINTTVYK